MEILIDVAAAAPDDDAWCAGLMACSDPWITLGRNLEACREALSRPGTELFVARRRESELPAASFCWLPTVWRGHLTSPASRSRRRRAGRGSDRNCCALPSGASTCADIFFCWCRRSTGRPKSSIGGMGTSEWES